MPTRTRTAFPRLSRTIDEIRADLYARVESVQDEYAAKGWLPFRLNLNKGVARGLIELFAWGLWQIYELLEKLIKQATALHAVNTWLDLQAQNVGLTRKTETKANGHVLFYRRESALGNVVIPAHRVVRTLPDGTGSVYRYVTTEQAVLPADEEYVAVPVESEEYGAGANAGPGQISQLVTPVNGIAGVSNTADWLANEGADAEKDLSLRERIWLRWMANNGCTKYAYKAWALSVPGVSSVEILDQHPRGQGTVGVVVLGSAVLPTEALLDRVRDAIRPQAPINDLWYVVAPDAVRLTIKGCLHYVTADPELLAREAELRILALFAESSPYPTVTPLAIGQDVPLDLLTATVMGITGVKSVDWTSPLEDVVVPKDGIAVLENVVFTTLAEREE